MRIFNTFFFCVMFMGCGSTNPGPGGTTGSLTTTAGGGTGVSGGAGTCSVSNAVQTNSVVMAGNVFDPNCIKMVAGDAVTWTNNDAVDHHVVTQSGQAVTFDLGNEPPNATASYTFTSVGSTDVRCAIHPDMTMTIFVTY